jgi:hypothetical protein
MSKVQPDTVGSTGTPRVCCSGTLLSRSCVESAAREGESVDAALARAFRSLVRHASSAAKGAAARTVAETFGAPLCRLLGFELHASALTGHRLARATLTARDEALALLVSLPFDAPLQSARAEAVSLTAGAGLRWCLLTNGVQLALLDCVRPHARRSLVFDVPGCAADARSLEALVSLVGIAAMQRHDDGTTRLEVLISRSMAELREMRATLQEGVERAALALTTALDRGRRRRMASIEPLFEQALTVVYRILFLRFAESRGLVPMWHPTYRRAYTIEALREAVEGQRDPRGMWEALQAIARLAHRGVSAAELSVVPFNGRLFSPAHAPAVASSSVPDAAAASVIAALTSMEGADGHRRSIAYSDLGVEQLGSIYERVLEFTPQRDPLSRAPLLLRGDTRKATGSFYTPRSLTEFIVRRTLDPLTREATPEQILSLRIVDPAMGSGAFLVAACRELARAYESALIRSGVAGAGDWSSADRAGFRRLVSRHCLYGVDLNPMAVQLGRLSIWLCSLAADKPLSFLDHRLRTGNSVLGASPEDVARRAPGGRSVGVPSLFGTEVMEAVGRASELRRAIAAIADDSAAQVHEKEAMLAALEAEDGPLSTWRRICDMWCACWFWPDPALAPRAQEFGALCDAIRGDRSSFTPALRQRLQTASDLARQHRFFHWQLEFPEVVVQGGFDAVVGNPPWDMVRGDPIARHSLRFTRDSGTFRFQSSGHGNLYQLFLERCLQLARPAGRLGIVLPWGLATDEGSASLRRRLLDHCTLDDMVVLDNRKGIFPIHRGLKFCALFAGNGGPSDIFAYRPGVCDITDLDRYDEADRAAAPDRIELSRQLLEALSGRSLAVPYVTTMTAVRILERLTASAPAAASPKGWGLRFGRELNASDDKDAFSEGGEGYPVIAGRHIEPFRVSVDRTSLRISPRDARERLGGAVQRPRLAYRDVAGAGNRLTLIAAVIPPRVVTTHTLFCLQTILEDDEQLFLCAVLNSYAANFLIRTRVGTHVTASLVHSLPMPRPPRASTAFTEIVSLARRGGSPELQAAVASLYALDRPMFETILATFPLISAEERHAALAAFAGLPGI